MNKTLTLKTSLFVAALLALPPAQAESMTQADYKAAKARIGADYKVDKAACASFTANANDICVEEAKGKEKVARAELEFANSAKPDDQLKVLVAKAEAGYAVAKERCDERTGNKKDVCLKEAKAMEVRTLADAKMAKQIGVARTEAVDDKRDAEYKVAVEKCDAMTGDAKGACVVAAKSRFGKT